MKSTLLLKSALYCLGTQSVLSESLVIIELKLLCMLKCFCGLGQNLHCLGIRTICDRQKTGGKLVNQSIAIEVLRKEGLMEMKEWNCDM